MDSIPSNQFVPWFRSVAPYIHAHKNKTFVIGITGELIAADKLNALIQDLALIHSLNINIVLVHGFRTQIEELLKIKEVKAHFAQGIRITDEAALACAQEAAGRLRYQIEAAFSQGLPNTPMAHAKIRVVSGNFVTAKPLGILHGTDFKHTGVVRKLDDEGIQQELAHNNIVLLSPFGYSPTGEAFNLTMEDIATQTALKLQASKLIFIGDSDGVGKQLTQNHAAGAASIEHELSVQQAEGILQKGKGKDHPPMHTDYLPFAIQAVKGGVERAHIIPYHVDGGILQELFTHHGLGTMIVDKKLDSLRQATVDDVAAIIQLIEPLEQAGIMIKRDRKDIERDINAYTVIEHDGVLFGCVACYFYPKAKTAELAALAVMPQAQQHGYGDLLLKHIEEKSTALGLRSIFVLTTQTMHWFISHGFKPMDPSWLPEEKLKFYDWERRSQVLVKPLRAHITKPF